ncbi:hypothetical protein cypCar_00028932, partial [Cyprinus carpio]
NETEIELGSLLRQDFQGSEQFNGPDEANGSKAHQLSPSEDDDHTQNWLEVQGRLPRALLQDMGLFRALSYLGLLLSHVIVALLPLISIQLKEMAVIMYYLIVENR